MSEETTNRGGISVEVEHIFPVIKKWLYSEKEIFLREIVSNACDAVTKLRRLASLGEAKDVCRTRASACCSTPMKRRSPSPTPASA